MKLSMPTKPKAPPVHKWENGFELHGLPELPERGVVGLLGGAGKTTALLILAGKLDPSCGWYALRQRYDVRTAGAHYRILSDALRSLEAQELRTSYKPQAVERLHHLPDFRRNLVDLNIDLDFAQALKLGGYETWDAEKLNTNALQRVSIAAALSKDAELYLLDCPSEHLDIEQRAKVANMIREKGKREIIVVSDNDITFLRWACTDIAIFYGDGRWGAPSQLYPAKEAISAFVSGMLPDGMRIRPKSKPGESPRQREKRMAAPRELMIQLAGVQKQFNGNVLQVDGEILRNERIGILGADCSGKSTLLKILAGKEECSGIIKGKPSVSFKPQHLSQRAVLKGISKELLQALGVSLRGRPRLTLSLRQRIAIARCLGADADLYILDQPSEGLTAEERLVVAELLRSKRSVIVADHDAWLVARVADRCGLVVRTDGRSHVDWMDAKAAINRIIMQD
ncbi:MAG: hypothetical protein QW548_00250 [Candidatus Aenigmatarchaeota archaeon]